VRRKLAAAGKFDHAKVSRRKNACNGNVSRAKLTSEARACFRKIGKRSMLMKNFLCVLQEDKAGEANSDDEYSSAMLVDPEQGFMGEFSIIIFINTIVLKNPLGCAGSREPPPRPLFACWFFDHSKRMNLGNISQVIAK
jgi:hypothetical protein